MTERGLRADPTPHVHSDAHPLPLIAPDPPALSRYRQELEEIEASGIYTNYGPMNDRLEHEFIEHLFGDGSCLTVCNATVGLMLAIQEVVGGKRPAQRRYALMPSFTFAATAQAALWCGLTPLFCDIDPHTWMCCPRHMERLLHQFQGDVAVMVPYATFGNNLDLEALAQLSVRYHVPIVVDAAASLGSRDARGRAFGSGFPWPVVFSMHATKSFSVGEGGLVYCQDKARIERLRSMGSFGFSQTREAMSIGLNSKLSEVTALIARIQLKSHAAHTTHQCALSDAYAQQLGPTFDLQRSEGQYQARSFQSLLLPTELAAFREDIIQGLAEAKIGAGKYFSPHVAEQFYFREFANRDGLPVTEDVASRILSLPLTSRMTETDVRRVTSTLTSVCAGMRQRHRITEPGSAQAASLQRVELDHTRAA